jgi:hypothetical protein
MGTSYLGECEFKSFSWRNQFDKVFSRIEFAIHHVNMTFAGGSVVGGVGVCLYDSVQHAYCATNFAWNKSLGI